MDDLKFQVACVGENDKDERFCFGWVKGIEDLTDEELETVAVDLMLRAGDGATVEVEGLGKLVESIAFTMEKQQLLGITFGESRWWVGCKVEDKRAWRAVRSNQQFRLLGVNLKTGRAGEMETNMELRKVDDGSEVIAKCVRASQSGDLSGISKADVEAALEQLAEQHAAKTGASVEQGYDAIMRTPNGMALYGVLEALKLPTAS